MADVIPGKTSRAVDQGQAPGQLLRQIAVTAGRRCISEVIHRRQGKAARPCMDTHGQAHTYTYAHVGQVFTVSSTGRTQTPRVYQKVYQKVYIKE